MKREDWIEAVANVVQRISDKKHQEEYWFGGKQDIVSWPEELYYQLFSDCSFEDFLISEEISLSPVQKKAGEDLAQKMEKYFPETEEWHFDPHEMFHDPEWEEVRKVARKFLEALQG